MPDARPAVSALATLAPPAERSSRFPLRRRAVHADRVDSAGRIHLADPTEPADLADLADHRAVEVAGPSIDAGAANKLSLEPTDESDGPKPSATTATSVTTSTAAAAPAPFAPASTGRRLAIPSWALGLGTRPLVATADVLALCAAALVTGLPLLQLLLFTAAALFLFRALGLYRSRLSMSVLDEVPRLTSGLLGAMALSLGAFRLIRGANHTVDIRYVWTTCVAFAFVLALRTIGYVVIRKMRVLGIGHRTLIVGAGRVGESVVNLLKQHPEYGLLPIGFVDASPLHETKAYDPPILGGHDELPAVLEQFNVRAVVIAFSQAREESMIDVIRACDRMRCEIFVVPRLFEVHHVSSDMDYAWSMPLSRLRRGSNRLASWRVKRIFDICSSAIAIFLLSPLLALIALAVRMEGGPGVLFKQVRVGLDGTYFQLLKFRSLRPVDETESATNWNISLDDRLGKVGRFLRKTSLDELPQLLNIFRGDMSVVGPRPERPHFVAQFGSMYPRYVARHRVPCGLTGWAQIHGLRGDTSIEDRARFDNYYVENWSLWLDVKIILRTITSVVSRAGS